MPDYILDANVFIQAQNGPYNMDVFPAFWEWIDQQTQAGIIASSTLVFDEIQGEGPLQDWIKSRKKSGLFITPSKDAQEWYSAILPFDVVALVAFIFPGFILQPITFIYIPVSKQQDIYGLQLPIPP